MWIVRREDWDQGVVQDMLPPADPPQPFVIQRYIDRPLLFEGRKFHFRCYAAMMMQGLHRPSVDLDLGRGRSRGDSLTGWLYRQAFILSAGLKYDALDVDVKKHITNLSVNKHLPGHPGQVPCDLPAQYPQVC